MSHSQMLFISKISILINFQISNPAAVAAPWGLPGTPGATLRATSLGQGHPKQADLDPFLHLPGALVPYTCAQPPHHRGVLGQRSPVPGVRFGVFLAPSRTLDAFPSGKMLRELL